MVAEVDHPADLVHTLRVVEEVGVGAVGWILPADEVLAGSFKVVEILEFGTRSDVGNNHVDKFIRQLNRQWDSHLGDLLLTEYVLP